jgi:hypothetical protein
VVREILIGGEARFKLNVAASQIIKRSDSLNPVASGSRALAALKPIKRHRTDIFPCHRCCMIFNRPRLAVER